MAKDRLSQFANVLIEEADAKRNKIEEELRKKKNQRLKQEDERLNIYFDSAIKSGKAELEHQKHLYLTRREEELHKTLLQNRQKTFNHVFDEVKNNVKAFTKTPEYEKMMITEFKDASSYFKREQGETICTVMQCDLEFVKKNFVFPEIIFNCSEQDFLGGFTLENAALRLFADCTLASKIEEQKKIFYKTSDLIFD